MKQEKVIRINNIKLKPDHTEAELLKAVKKALRLKTVSYTHLTLPTNSLV